jgi:metal-responsive CopG/Arc/MetJ family transcriptional regulator
MRILVDVPKPDLELLDKVTKRYSISRAEFIRQAIAASLTPYRQKMNHSAFGAWSELSEDGLAYQERVRAEW